MAKFNTDQQLAIDSANRERRMRGMPDWDAKSFMACNPLKFPGQEAGSLEAEPTPLPPAPLGNRRTAARAIYDREEADRARQTAEVAAAAEAAAPPATLHRGESDGE